MFKYWKILADKYLVSLIINININDYARLPLWDLTLKSFKLSIQPINVIFDIFKVLEETGIRSQCSRKGGNKYSTGNFVKE